MIEVLRTVRGLWRGSSIYFLNPVFRHMLLFLLWGLVFINLLFFLLLLVRWLLLYPPIYIYIYIFFFKKKITKKEKKEARS
jgi:predicted membrane protein